MRIDLKEDVVSLTDFARNTKQHAKELAEGGWARILTQNGKATVVVRKRSTEHLSHFCQRSGGYGIYATRLSMV